MEKSPTTSYVSNEGLQQMFDALVDMGAEQRKQTVRTDQDADRIMIVPIARAQEKLTNQLSGKVGKLPWQDKALCGQLKDTEKEYFHAPEQQRQLLAKAVCRACVVWEECKDYSVANHEPYSVWGGESEKERREERRRRSRAWSRERRGY